MGTFLDQLSAEEREAVDWKVHDNLELAAREKETQHPHATIHVPDDVREYAEKLLASLTPGERQTFIARTLAAYQREEASGRNV